MAWFLISSSLLSIWYCQFEHKWCDSPFPHVTAIAIHSLSTCAWMVWSVVPFCDWYPLYCQLEHEWYDSSVPCVTATHSILSTWAWMEWFIIPWCDCYILYILSTWAGVVQFITPFLHVTATHYIVILGMNGMIHHSLKCLLPTILSICQQSDSSFPQMTTHSIYCQLKHKRWCDWSFPHVTATHYTVNLGMNGMIPHPLKWLLQTILSTWPWKVWFIIPSCDCNSLYCQLGHEWHDSSSPQVTATNYIVNLAMNSVIHHSLKWLHTLYIVNLSTSGVIHYSLMWLLLTIL